MTANENAPYGPSNQNATFTSQAVQSGSESICAHDVNLTHTHTKLGKSVLYQAEQTADLINGPQAAQEGHEHGEAPDSDQDVAGHLQRRGVTYKRETAR